MTLQTHGWKENLGHEYDFYAPNDCTERLTHKDIGAAIGEFLDNESNEDLLEKLNNKETIEIFAYRRSVVGRNECLVVNDLAEHLDEEYGDPDGCHSTLPKETPEELLAAEQAFIEVFLKHYTPWICEPAAIITVQMIELYADMSEAERKEYFPNYEEP